MPRIRRRCPSLTHRRTSALPCPEARRLGRPVRFRYEAQRGQRVTSLPSVPLNLRASRHSAFDGTEPTCMADFAPRASRCECESSRLEVPARRAERALGTLPSVGTSAFRHTGGNVAPERQPARNSDPRITAQIAGVNPKSEALPEGVGRSHRLLSICSRNSKGAHSVHPVAISVSNQCCFLDYSVCG